MASTFSALVTETKDFLNRDDLTDAKVASFIGLAEAHLNKRLRVREMVERSTTALNEEYEYVPSDFLEARRIYISNTSPTHELRAMSPQALTRAYSGSTAGRPQAYAIISSQMQFRPPPDSGSAYTLEMTYYARIAALSDTNQSNGVLDNYEDLYLYATCAVASTYLLDDQGVARYGGLRDRLIEEANAATDAHQYAAGSLVVEGIHAVAGSFR